MDPALEKVFEVPKALRASSVWTHYAVEKQERFITVPLMKQVQLWKILLVRPRFTPVAGTCNTCYLSFRLA